MRCFPILLMSLILAAPLAAQNQMRALQSYDQRVATLAYRLQRSNAELCGGGAPLSGFLLHDLNLYAPSARAEAKAVFGLGNGPSVLALVPGSPAARAGLLVDDRLETVGGATLTSPPSKSASFETIRAAEGLIASKLATPPVRLERSAKPPIRFTPEAGCPSRTVVVPGGRLNAKADGDVLELTTGIIDFAGNDDALATVIAHELAHNILGHYDALKKAGRTRKRIRATEVEADYWSVYLMLRAGFDADRMLDLWTRYENRTNLGWLADGTHPGKKERLGLIRATIAEFREKQRKGIPLRPNTPGPLKAR
jgi:beta-barrel assembly-enhancing protease